MVDFVVLCFESLCEKGYQSPTEEVRDNKSLSED